MPERGGGVAVTKPSLSLEQLPTVDKMGGHPVTEPVQRRIRYSRSSAEIAEPVGQRVRGQISLPEGSRREDPVLRRCRPALIR